MPFPVLAQSDDARPYMIVVAARVGPYLVAGDWSTVTGEQWQVAASFKINIGASDSVIAIVLGVFLVYKNC